MPGGRRESGRSLPLTTSSEETIISIQRQRLTGWKNRIISEKIAIDIYGNETRAVETLDRFKRTRTRTTYTPDSNTPLQAFYVDGRLAATTSKTGITMTLRLRCSWGAELRWKIPARE